ncbi:drug resistance transporter, EmrB/QacA subfamily [Cohnella sp. OV330]|uniref:MFS transporter n=1 Tax=Cohnella sp. OV330 TaxID=1855288 RepID=UPI0008EF6641|nr:MFS transporter [Cohnella sp. OV330]SFB44554.1 drug resistance transporter, EmrB/QacA subfamily [Cohnella sp. OV330]
MTYQDDPIIQKNRWLILVILNLFTFMATLDGSIVNIALPVVSRELRLPVAQTEWIVTAYLMTICAAILFFGKLGDIIGKIKIFRLGMMIFTVGSLLCGLSTSLTAIVASRLVQALGASMTMANSQGIVTDIFPGSERGKALGLTGTFVSLGIIAGPSLGGIILSSLGWEYIFWVNVPVGLAALAIGWRKLPEDLTKLKVKIDAAGSALFTVFILLLFAGLLLGQQYGYGQPWIMSSLVVSAIVFVYFIRFEKRTVSPLLQLSMFRNPLFSLSILCGFLVFVSNSCFNIVAPFYVQDVLGLTPSQAGLLMMLFPIVMVVVAPLSGALSDKIGSELLTFIGLIVLVVAQLGMSRLDGDSSIALAGAWMALLGLGSGLFQSPNNSLVMSKVPKTQLGIAGSINALIRNVGMVAGITLATTTLFAVMSAKAGSRIKDFGSVSSDLFLAGMHVVFLAASAICMVGALLTGWRLWSARRSAREKPLNA